MNNLHQYEKGDPEEGCKPCKEEDNLTQKGINKERIKICNSLYESAGILAQKEIKFDGEQEVYNNKKCMFNWTEENYQRYRNFEISIGTELHQTNESIKANLADHIKWNKSLNENLKNVAKQIKEVKSKFSELSNAAWKLGNCIDDKCNIAQRKALTGNAPGCPPGTAIDDCKEAEKILEELRSLPQNGMTADIDSIFQSAHDVVGIQMFSNIDLETMQKALEDRSKDFKNHISEVLKVRQEDLKKMQDDLVKAVQETTKAAMDRNKARSDFEGYYDAVNFLCCPDCMCLPEEKKDDSDKEYSARLKDCEDCICKICEEVKKAFCCKPIPTGKPEEEGEPNQEVY